MKRLLSILLIVAVLSTLIIVPAQAATAVNLTTDTYKAVFDNKNSGNLNAYLPASKHKEVLGFGGKAADDSSIALTNIGNQVDSSGAVVANSADREKGMTLSDVGYPYIQFSPADMVTRDDYIVVSFNIYLDNSKPFTSINFTTNSGTAIGPNLPSNQLIRNQWNKITYVFKMNAGAKSVMNAYINGRIYTTGSTEYTESWETVLGTSGKTVIRVGPKFNSTVNYVWKEGAPAFADKDEEGNWLLTTANFKSYIEGPGFDAATGVVYMDDFNIYSTSTAPVITDTAAHISGPIVKSETNITAIHGNITVLEGSKLSDFTFANSTDATIKLYKDATLAEEITDANHVLAAGNVITTSRATDYRKYIIEAVHNGKIIDLNGSAEMGSNSTGVTTVNYADPVAGDIYKQSYVIPSGGNTYLKDYAWLSKAQVRSVNTDYTTARNRTAFLTTKDLYNKYVHIGLNYMVPAGSGITRMYLGSNGHGGVGSNLPVNTVDGKWHHMDVIVNRSNGTSKTYVDGAHVGDASSCVLGNFGYNKRDMFQGVRFIVYAPAGSSFDMYLDDLTVTDMLSTAPMTQTLSGVSASGTTMQILSGTKVADIKAANPTATIVVQNGSEIVADDAVASVDGYTVFVKTANNANRTYTVAEWDGITVHAESADGIPTDNIALQRIENEVVTGGLGGEAADNKYSKITRTFVDVRENDNPDDDKLYTNMDANMYFHLAKEAVIRESMSKYFVTEFNVWNNDNDTLSINIGTNSNGAVSGSVSGKDMMTGTWNKYVNVISLTPNSAGRYPYVTYFNGRKISEGLAVSNFITKNKAYRIIIQTTPNLIKEGSEKPAYSDIKNTIYIDNVRIYESVNHPVVDGYTNEAVNTAAAYAEADSSMVVATGNAADVGAAVAAATGADATVYSGYTAENGGTENTGAIAEGDVVVTKANGIYKLYNVEAVNANSVKMLAFKDGYRAIANTSGAAKVVAAAYGADNAMTDVVYADAAGNWTVTDAVSTDGASLINAMLIDGFDTLKPLSASSTKTIE